MADPLLLLKLALLAFWTAWFAVVFLSNLFGALKAMGRLPASWVFASANYEAVVKATGGYRPPRWLPPLLFAGVLAWQLALAVASGCALWASCRAGAIDLSLAGAALGGGMLLWAAFMLADEVTLKYEFERTHELLFLSQAATLGLMHLS
jgi:hypothetical protein